MLFSLDVVRAGKGDCLFLHYGTKTTPRLMLIDGGPSGVYRSHLRPRIEQIKAARGLGDQAALPVDVLLISHVDDDHIQGILDLTTELREQKTNREAQLVRVSSLWHNTFDDLLDTTPAELDAAAGFGAAALDGRIDLEDEEELDAAKVLASIPQGRALRDDAALLARGSQTWRVNREFGGKLILATRAAKNVKLTGGVTLTVVGPLQPELLALQKRHDAWLKATKNSRRKDGAEAALAAFVDSSITNLSSVVLLAEAGRRRILLTGDARGDKIIAGLEQAQLLKRGTTGKLHVDVLKVPHHGSARNVETSFFRRVTADHYVLSGNGEHGNPERETVEMIVEARGTSPFTLHFTYPFEEIDAARKVDWVKQQKEEKKKGKKPRPNWSAKKHGLDAWLNDHPLANGQHVVTMGTGSHVIDLLDPLGV